VAATIQQGVHYRKLESDISAYMSQQVLEALNHPGIANALQRMPIEKISIGRLGDKQQPGVVRLPRAIGLH
jgi:hypothetical protein